MRLINLSLSNNAFRKTSLEALFDQLSSIIDEAEDNQSGFVPSDLDELNSARDSISRLMK